MQVNGKASSESRVYVVSTVYKGLGEAFDSKVRTVALRKKVSSLQMLTFRVHPQVFAFKAQAVDSSQPAKGPQTFAKADIDVAKFASASPTGVSKTIDLVLETKASAPMRDSRDRNHHMLCLS